MVSFGRCLHYPNRIWRRSHWLVLNKCVHVSVNWTVEGDLCMCVWGEVKSRRGKGRVTEDQKADPTPPRCSNADESILLFFFVFRHASSAFYSCAHSRCPTPHSVLPFISPSSEAPSLSLIISWPVFVLYCTSACAIDAWHHSCGCTHYNNSCFACTDGFLLLWSA